MEAPLAASAQQTKTWLLNSPFSDSLMAFERRTLNDQTQDFSYETTDVRHEYLKPRQMARCCPLDSAPLGARWYKQAISPSLGTVDVLPLELRINILCQLDIRSLIILRRISRRSRLTVDELPHYKVPRIKGPELLRAVIGLEITNSGSVLDAYQALTSQSCARSRRSCLYCLLRQRRTMA